VANALYFVVSGSVGVRASARVGAPELGTIPAGAHFGGEGCLLNARWTVDLRAAGVCELQLIENDVLQMLLAHYADVGAELYATAVERLETSPLLEVDEAPPGVSRGVLPRRAS